MDPPTGRDDTGNTNDVTSTEGGTMFRRRAIKPQLAVLISVTTASIVAAAVFASLAFGTEPATKTVEVQPCGDRIFGHIASIERASAQQFELRFDPAFLTSGVTAGAAAAEDGAVERGQPVPNDSYVVDESHRLLSYLVPEKTPVTVLTSAGDPERMGATPISVVELARIVNGGEHRPLFEPLESGIWLRVHFDTACSIDQQYRP
jgi:hypothetical protein